MAFVLSPSKRLCVVSASMVIASAIAARPARADLPSIDTRTWRPSTDPSASLVVEPAVTPGAGVLSFGAWSHYSYRPLVLKRPGGDVALRPLEHVVGLDATANVGIGERFALGAVVPLVLFQEGASGLPGSVSSVDRAPASAIGDIGLSMKAAIVPFCTKKESCPQVDQEESDPDRRAGGGFRLAGLGNVSLPTGTKTSFAGEGAVTATARLLAEYTLIVASVQASVGYRLRTVHRTWPASEAGGVTFGDEIPWTVGLAFRPAVLGIDPGNRQRLEIAAHGWVPAGPAGPFGSGDPGSSALSPALLAVSDRVELGRYRDAFVLGGGEFGLTDAIGVPAFRVLAAVGWSPREHDKDHDGVRDDLDGCPEIPEDRDGFEDSDGCPEIDNDDDGILDKEDACPLAAGAESSAPKKNGCPIADEDGDGVENALDACPGQKGETSKDPKRNGCPVADGDGDGFPDDLDKCPTQPEDKDGFEDDDGCPDPDNDKDGISDKDDACRDVKGETSSDPAQNGCPNRDRDGDTIANDVDKCPDQPETWNGVADEDGCPDEGGKALVTIDAKRIVRFAKPLELTGSEDAPEVAAQSLPFLRALATELARHPEWTLAVGARPAGGVANKAQLTSLSRALAVVRELSTMVHRDGVAETVGWDIVARQPAVGPNLAFLLLTSAPEAR
jgi:OOP family OmpA-OmpF porin